MFEKLFRKSRTQIDADAAVSHTTAEKDHGTIAAAPHALTLLRSSNEASVRHLSPDSPEKAEHTLHDGSEQAQEQLNGGEHASTSAHGSLGKPWQRRRHADVPATDLATHHADDHELVVGPGQSLQPEDDESTAEQLFNGQPMPAVIAPVVLPALCQVRPSAEYMQQQKQHSPSQQKQQLQHNVQPAPQPPQESRLTYQPAFSSRDHQQLGQSCMPHLPATLDYGSWLQQHHQQQQPSSIEALQQKLLMEAKAREELEDMLLRYERHLKAETAARLAAEQKAAAVLNQVTDFRQQIASNGEQAKQQSSDLAAEQAAVQQERAELEQMRSDFEAQLHTARSELARAKAALSSNEDRVRAAEAEERMQLVAEYEMRLSGMMSEVECLREEVARRTQLLTTEMERWKRQATLNAAAVIEAKNEVLERKRELDSTKDKLDHLVEKLYAGREANVSLSGAIAAAANYQQVSTDQFLAQQATSMSSLTGGRSSMGGTAAAAGSMGQQLGKAGTDTYHLEDDTRAVSSTSGYKAAQRNPAAHKRADSKALVPTLQQKGRLSQVAAATGQFSPHHVSQHAGSIMSEVPPLQFLSVSGGPSMIKTHQQQQQTQPRSSLVAASRREPPHLQAITSSPRDSNTSRIPHPGHAAANKDHSSTADPHHLPGISSRSARQHTTGQDRSHNTNRSKVKKDEGGSYAQLHSKQQAGAATEGTVSARGPKNDAFRHVVSRYAQPAAGSSSLHFTQARAKEKSQTKEKQLPDRFAEGAKNAAMIAAMAHKFG